MQQRVILVAVFAVALVFSIIMGTAIGEADYQELSVYGVIAMALIYFTVAYRWTWQLILIISYLGFNYIHGFSLESQHLAIVLLTLYSGISIFRGHQRKVTPVFRQCGGGLVVGLCIIWLIYGVVHFVLNMAFPHIVNQFSIGNALKQYFVAFMPSALLVWMLVGPVNFTLNLNWERTMLAVRFMALGLNILIMGYLFMMGFGVSDPTAVGGTDEPIGLVIPVINAIPNIFVLRSLGPGSVLVAFAFLSFSEWKKKQPKWVILGLWVMCGMGVLGSLVSGGRAAVLIAGFYVFVVCVARRRVGIIATGTALAMIGIGLANVFSDWVNHESPLFVSRPLQYVMIDKGEAMDSISSSSEYRTELYIVSIEEWMSDPRLTFIGRSVYAYQDDLMELKRMYGDKEAFIMTNLRAGNCHALLPSVLVQYGGIGAVLYYAIYLAIIRMFWKLYARARHMDPRIRVIAFVSAVGSTVGIIVATLGGGWFSVLYPLTLGILRSAIAVEEDRMKRQEALAEASETLPQPGR